MRPLSCLLLLLVLGSFFVGQAPAITGQVSASHPLAMEVGQSILLQGGNAVDAAVAAAFALGVLEPYRAGIGGGAVLLVRPAGDTQPIVIDALETAPRMAQTRETEGWHSVGLPGTLSGLTMALELYGTMGLSFVLEGPIQLAQKGISVDAAFHGQLRQYQPRLSQTASQVYLRRAEPLRVGEKLVQRDLAWTYRQIARDGAAALYQGLLARRLVHAAPGTWFTAQNLADYRPQMRRPIHTTYRTYDVLTVPPPCTGGMQLLQCLNMLEPFDMQMLEHNSPEYVHVLAEVSRRCGLDRWKYAGDQEALPLKQLASKEYAVAETIPIQLGSMSRWHDVAVSPLSQYGSSASAAVVASDTEGNMVVIVQTLHGAFGSGIMVPGTGILLNCAMADFSTPPENNADSQNADSQNAELAALNQIVPGKRPASSLGAAIVLHNGKPVLGIADAGEANVPSVPLQILLNCVDFRMSTEMALARPRLQLDFQHERLLIEWGMAINIPALARKGHSIRRLPQIGQPQVVGSIGEPLSQP